MQPEILDGSVLPGTDAHSSIEELAAANPEETAFEQQVSDDSFGELIISPYSPSRKVAAQRMGLLFPFVGDEGVSRVNSGGIYPGALMDVGIVLWLCTLPDESKTEWTPRKALSTPDRAVDEVMKFLEDHDLVDIGGKPFNVAFAKFMNIVQGVSDNQFEAALEGDTARGEASPKT